MAFLAPKTELPSDLSVNTPGRATRGSPTEVLPWVRGRGRCVVRWMTPVLHWHFRNTKTSSFAFFSCYGWIAWGPADEIAQIIVNGKAYNGVFVHRDANPGDYYEHVLAKETPEYFRFYWGNDDAANYTSYLQSLVRDAAHPMRNKTHPRYKNIFALACKDVEAGRADGGRTPPLPQIEITFHKRSEKTYSLGHAAHGTHALGIAHDLLVSQRGGGRLPVSLLNAAQWDAKIDQLQTTGLAGKAGSDLWISTVLDQPRPLGDHLVDILAHVDAHVRERDGKLEVDYFPSDGSTADPTGLREISEHERAGDLQLEDTGLEKLTTKVIVTGQDWQADPELSEASEDAQVPFAEKLLGEQRPPENIARPGFVSRAQLKAYAELRAAMLARPELRATVPVLRQYATHPDNVTPLRPGDRFNLDDAEKGLDLVVRILERREDGVRVIFKVVGERGAFPQPYSPALDPRADLTLPAPADLARYTVAQFPPDLSDAADTVCAALVERPSNSDTGFDVHFSPSDSWPGQVIASGVVRWAVCAVLQTALGATLGDATITVDTVGDDWSYLRSQSALEQGDDQLLMYRAGEWSSIGTITPLGGGSYSLVNAKRARLGSLPAAHAIGDVMFFVLRSDLVALTHADFANVEVGGAYDVTTATKWFKLRPLGPGGVQGNLTAAFSLVLRDPTPDAITDLEARTGTGKIVELRWTRNTTALVREYHVYRATGPAFADEVEIGQTGGENSRFFDLGVVLGTQYRYRLKIEATDDAMSGWSNAALATPGVIAGTEVDNTPPTNPGAMTKADEGTYLADDGTVMSYIVLNVPQVPADAIGVIVKRRRAGATGAFETVGQSFNTDGATTIRQDDMSPNTAYDFGLEAFKWSGATSALVLGTGSPYTAAKKTSLPTAPSVGSLAPDTTAPASKADKSGILFGCRVSVTAPADKDIVAIEVKVTLTDTNEAIDYSWGDWTSGNGIMRRACTPQQVVALTVYNPLVSPGSVRARSCDSSGNVSPWFRVGQANSNCTQAVGDLALQSKSDVSMSGVKLGAASAGSVQQQRATYGGSYVYNSFVGGAATETFTIDISGRGFDFKPDDASFTWQHGQELDFSYLSEDAGSTASQVVIQARAKPGNTIAAASPTRFGFRFWENP